MSLVFLSSEVNTHLEPPLRPHCASSLPTVLSLELSLSLSVTMATAIFLEFRPLFSFKTLSNLDKHKGIFLLIDFFYLFFLSLLSFFVALMLWFCSNGFGLGFVLLMEKNGRWLFSSLSMEYRE